MLVTKKYRFLKNYCFACHMTTLQPGIPFESVFMVGYDFTIYKWKIM